MEMLTVPVIAKEKGWPEWAIRRIFELGKLPMPARAGQVRLIPRRDLPKIERALLKCGYIQPANGEAQKETTAV